MFGQQPKSASQLAKDASALIENFSRQLASLYSRRQRLYVSTFKSVHLLRAFESLGSLFHLLITCDHLAAQRGTRLGGALRAYQRLVRGMKQDPPKYGANIAQLAGLEAHVGELERLLCSGSLFRDAISQPFELCVHPFQQVHGWAQGGKRTEDVRDGPSNRSGGPGGV